jgi:hypothetical protein
VTHIPSDHEVWFRYDHTDFDFLLYFNVEKGRRNVSLGFIERKGDILEDLGSRVYTPLMLEGAVRLLNQEFARSLK